jgi:cold shock CspA family protein
MNQSAAKPTDGRLLGHVEKFDFDRGLGMIWSGGQEFLFHCAEIVDGTRDINIGESVSFVVAHRFGLVEASEIEKLPN